MKDEIFESFFEKLNEDEEISEETVDRLKELRPSGDLGSREEIIKALRLGEDSGED